MFYLSLRCQALTAVQSSLDAIINDVCRQDGIVMDPTTVGITQTKEDAVSFVSQVTYILDT